MYHEGAGDALFCGDTLFAGYRIRSDVHGHQWLGERIGVRVLPLELVNPRFLPSGHLLLPAGPRRGDLLSRTPSTTTAARCLQSHVPKLIPVAKPRRTASAATPWWSARRWSTTRGCPQLAADLRAWGYEPIEVELDEFLKAGGSAKCLTLRLDGEEAAAW